MCALDRSDRSVHLVLEDDPVVAQDLVELLRAHDPDRDTIHVSSRAEALDVLQRCAHVAVAVLDGGVASDELFELSRRIGAFGGRVIVLSDTEPEPGTDLSGCEIVQRPFTSRMILDALTRRDG